MSWHLLALLLARRLSGARPLGFQCCGLLNNVPKHSTGFAAFYRAVGAPDVGRVFGQNLVKIQLAFHAERSKLRDVEVARPLVPVLDEQPRTAIGRARVRAHSAIALAAPRISPRAHEHP